MLLLCNGFVYLIAAQVSGDTFELLTRLVSETLLLSLVNSAVWSLAVLYFLRIKPNPILNLSAGTWLYES